MEAIFTLFIVVFLFLLTLSRKDKQPTADEIARSVIVKFNCKAMQQELAEKLFTDVYKDTEIPMHNIVMGDLQKWLEQHRDHNTRVHTPEGFGRCVRMVECKDCNEMYIGSELVNLNLS